MWDLIPKAKSKTPLGVYEFGKTDARHFYIIDKEPGSKYAAIGYRLGDNGDQKVCTYFSSVKRRSYGFELIDEHGGEYYIIDGKFTVQGVAYIQKDVDFLHEFQFTKGFAHFLASKNVMLASANGKVRNFYQSLENSLYNNAAKVPAILQLRQVPQIPGIEKYGMRMQLIHDFAIGCAFQKDGYEYGLGQILAHNERLMHYEKHCKDIGELALALGANIPLPTGASTNSTASESGSSNRSSRNCNSSDASQDGYMITTPISLCAPASTSGKLSIGWCENIVNGIQGQHESYLQVLNIHSDSPMITLTISDGTKCMEAVVSTKAKNQCSGLRPGSIIRADPADYTLEIVGAKRTAVFIEIHCVQQECNLLGVANANAEPPHYGIPLINQDIPKNPAPSPLFANRPIPISPYLFKPPQTDMKNSGADEAFQLALHQSTPVHNQGIPQWNFPNTNRHVAFEAKRFGLNQEMDEFEETCLDADGDTKFANLG